jgi:hypothetical protein
VRCAKLKFYLYGTLLVVRRRFLFNAAPTAVAAAAVSGRPHLASGTDVLRAYTSTFFLAADWAFISAVADRSPPETLGYQLPYTSRFISQPHSRVECRPFKYIPVRAVEKPGARE